MITRRNFFKKLGQGTTALAVAAVVGLPKADEADKKLSPFQQYLHDIKKNYQGKGTPVLAENAKPKLCDKNTKLEVLSATGEWIDISGNTKIETHTFQNDLCVTQSQLDDGIIDSMAFIRGNGQRPLGIIQGAKFYGKKTKD